MIKLVATDLDGTLLPPHEGVPEITFEIIESLYKKGIIFCAASGRQLPNLKMMFASVLDKIAIIAENGGTVYYKGKIIYSNPTPADKILYALEIINREKGLHPLLSCSDCAYYQSKNAKFVETVHRSYSSAKHVDNLAAVTEFATVYKISVWDEQPPCATHGGIILPPKIKGLRTMVSGYDWLDVCVLNANKGEALKALMNRLGVNSDEVEAFGDHMNDLEMLQVCGHPFVTANAFAGLKEKIKNTVPSNADYGVIQKLKELI